MVKLPPPNAPVPPRERPPEASAAAALFLAGPKGALRWVNPGFRRLFGLPGSGRAEWAGLLTGDQVRSLRRLFEDGARTGTVEHTFRLEAPRRRTLRLEAHLTNGAGEPPAWVGVLHELTGKTPALLDGTPEAEVPAAAGRGMPNPGQDIPAARELTAQQAAELSRQSEALDKARDAALEAMRLQRNFLATMSHEIRTPLNGILGMAQLLRETDLDREQHDVAAIIAASAEALIEIINDILDYTKGEAGKLTLRRTEFSPRRVMEEAVSLFRGRAAAKHLDLEVQVSEQVPAALIGDAGRLRQVLMNLVSNAIKFTDAGSVTVTADKWRQQDGEVTLAFEVRDTGIGLSEDADSYLFVPFAQGDDSAVRCLGGTGLGLAICRQLTELMGGEISAQGKPGQGSVFRFTARFEKVRETGHRRPAGPRSESWQTGRWAPNQSNGPRVLVAEDNLVNQKVAAAFLERLGCTVEAAADGRAAVEAATRKPFDLILMDCQMPGMDGFEAARRIRSREAAGRHTPIIAVTASAMQGDRERCLNGGMDDYISKPIAGADLLEIVRKWVPELTAPLV